MSLKESLLDSRLFHNACTWELLSSPALATIRHAYITPMRIIANMQNRTDSEHYTNDQVLVQMSRPSINDKLRILRLTYLPRFLTNSTPHLLRLALAQYEYKDAWVNLIIEDLIWMWNSHDNLFTSMAKPSSCPHTLRIWFDYIVAAPASWKTMISKFKRRFNCPAHAVSAESVPEGVRDDFVCEVPFCGMRFDTFASLRTHQAAKHDLFNPIRYRVNSSRCVSCMKEFHTVSRAFRHIAYRNSTCKAYYLMLDPLLSNEQVVELMSSERVMKKSQGDTFIPPPAA